MYYFCPMKIEKYISELLYRYSCVIVPGFGAFVTEIRSAYFDEKLGVFYPPQKIIRFSAQIKSNDGLLANEIALSENISYEKALVKIETAVLYWQNALKIDHKIALENIGDFYQPFEGLLTFEPLTSVNYLTSSFGLQPLFSPKIKREIKEVSSTNTPLVTLKTATEEPKTKRFAFVKYAAVFLLSASLVVTLYNSYTTFDFSTNETINEATFFNVPTTTAKKTLKFHIVAGVFKSIENAEVKKSQLETEGFEAAIVTRNNGTFSVLYKSFPTYTEAQYNLTQIKNNQNPEAWLLIEDL